MSLFKDESDCITFAMGFIIGFVLVLFIAACMDISSQRLTEKRAVEINKAEYSSKTGELVWLDQDVRYIILGRK